MKNILGLVVLSFSAQSALAATSVIEIKRNRDEHPFTISGESNFYLTERHCFTYPTIFNGSAGFDVRCEDVVIETIPVKYNIKFDQNADLLFGESEKLELRIFQTNNKMLNRKITTSLNVVNSPFNYAVEGLIADANNFEFTLTNATRKSTKPPMNLQRIDIKNIPNTNELFLEFTDIGFFDFKSGVIKTQIYRDECKTVRTEQSEDAPRGPHGISVTDPIGFETVCKDVLIASFTENSSALNVNIANLYFSDYNIALDKGTYTVKVSVARPNSFFGDNYSDTKDLRIKVSNNRVQTQKQN